MAAFGQMFPTPKISEEKGEAGTGQPWRLGRIDLDNNTVELVRGPAENEPADGPADPAGGADGGAGR